MTQRALHRRIERHRLWRTLLLLILPALLALAASGPAATAPGVELEAFIEEMASKHGFDRLDLKGLFEQVRIRPQIVELLSRSSRNASWRAYRPLFVNRERIQGGSGFWSRHQDALARARARFGVPEETIVAIIGVETHYGRNTGSFKVLDALTTLAFNDPRRADMFRAELEQYLLLSREEVDVQPLGTRGSPAGAIGIAQFMPGSYRHYGIDFDGDGRRDLVGNAVDAIGSVANYLKEHGWKDGQPVVIRAQVEGDLYSVLIKGGIDSHYYLAAMERLGVRPLETLPGHLEARLFRLDADEGIQYWLGMNNFRVLTRYNRSTYYAMAVHELAQEIRSLRERAPAR